MSVKISFECDGCNAESGEAIRIRREHVYHPVGQMNGIPMSRVERRPFDVQAAAPDGWVASDPYTACTYCPECWAIVESDTPAEVEPPTPTKGTPHAE